MKKSLGFTLAEVLITLGIIGVVAAMTIPTLMNNTSNVEYRTGFKKIISTLSQAVTMNVALENTDFSLLTTGASTDSGSFLNMFVNRMNLVKTTGNVDAVLDSNVQVKVADTTNYTLYFNDGMVFSFRSAATSCVDGDLIAACTAIVDVNGYKRPNRLTLCSAHEASVASDTATATTCTSTAFFVHDRFSVRMEGQEVVPNGNAARWALYNN